MSEQTTDHKATTNGKQTFNPSRKGSKKQWRDLDFDPLSEGFTEHVAQYVTGNSPINWLSVQPGQLFSRNKTGKSLYVKMNDGRAICLDTKQTIEIKPTIRMSFQVWLVTQFNSTTASATGF